jgi:hypothetical protein
MLNYLGDLGGLFDIMHLLGMFFTSFIVRKLFFANLINSVYWVQKYVSDTSELALDRSVVDDSVDSALKKALVEEESP